MSESSSTKKWFPLESNPDIMNRYIEKLGVPTDSYAFTDVFGLDDELLQMVPQPVLAVLLLYPITKENEAASKLKDSDIEQHGQILSSQLYFLKQTVGNACGTVGIIHAIANNASHFSFTDGFMQDFLKLTGGQNADERAKALEKDEKVEAAHESSAQQGSGNIDMDTNLHFVCFVEKEGHLYELDGRRAQPVNHGSSSSDTLLYDVARVVKQYMALNPDDVNWNVVALSSAQ